MSLYSQKTNGSSDSTDEDDYEEDKKLLTTPDAGFIGDLRTVFGNHNSWGESLGVAYTNVEVEDGVLYKHSEKDEYKLFSWEEIIGAHPAQYDRDVEATEPNQFYTKDYGVAKVQYEFVGARIATVTNQETGEVLCEEDTAGEYQFGNIIMWFDGNDAEPNGAAKSMAKKMTSLGNDAVVPLEEAEAEHGQDDSYYNDDGEFQWMKCWLTDTSNDNIAREDLQGRTLRFYKDVRDSDKSDNSFHYPVVEDVKTGKEIKVSNEGTTEQSGSDSNSSDSTDSNSGNSNSSNSGTPEPIQDFLDTVGSMEADEVLAQSLLDDMVEEPDNSLTEDMVDGYGGERELIEAVIE